MGKDKSPKRNKKTGKLKDLPAKTKRAGGVKGGTSRAGGGDPVPTENVSLNFS